MKKLLALTVIVLLTSCEASTPTEPTTVVRGTTRVEGYAGAKIFYIADPRTGFCFAVTEPGTHYGTMAAVDCIPKVLMAIQEDRPKEK